MSETVGGGQFRIAGRQLAGEGHDHLALLARGVVLHLAVEHDRAGAVTHRLDHPHGVGDVGSVAA